MSASVYYQAESGAYLDVGGGKSSFLTMLENLFNSEGPYVFDSIDAITLQTAEKVLENEQHRKALRILIHAIELSGRVRVWAEY